MFDKSRARRARDKMQKCVRILDSIDERLAVTENQAESETLKHARVRAKEDLDRATWKAIRLHQSVPGWTPVKNDSEEADGILEKLDAIREKEGLPPFMMDNNYVSFSKRRIVENEEALDNAEKLSDKEAEVDVREANRLIHELVAMVYKINNPIVMVTSDLPDDMPPVELMNKVLEEKIEQTTLGDLEEAAKQKMVEENPSLQGDLVMLLHRLGDPENHPISLLDLADKAMKGECENVELIARALDRLVDDYRETLSTRQQFEMSERDCLVAMDEERGTTC